MESLWREEEEEIKGMKANHVVLIGSLVIVAVFIGFISALLFNNQHSSVTSGSPPTALSSVSIEDGIRKSPLDQRAIKSLVLDNKIKVVTISDPLTSKAHVAINVGVGYASDPVEHPGLAHFTEHMIFQGSEKYPSSDTFLTFLSNHNGVHNAYTTLLYTNYHFSCDAPFLGDGLDILSAAFDKPSFTDISLSREIMMVDEEFQKNSDDDRWRVEAILRMTSNSINPNSKFSTGSAETLAGVTHEVMGKFFNDFYTTDRIVITVIAPQSGGEMEEAVKATFGALSPRLSPLPSLSPEEGASGEDPPSIPLRTPAGLGVKYEIVPLADVDRLGLYWVLPNDLTESYKSKKHGYIVNMLSSTKQGSLFQILRRDGWIDSLSVEFDSQRGSDILLKVNFDLTMDGLQHIDDVIESTFKYIAAIKKSGVEKKMWDEYATIAAAAFAALEPSSSVEAASRIATTIQEGYPISDAVFADFDYSDWQPSGIMAVVEELSSKNMFCFIITRNSAVDSPVPFQVEKRFKVKYRTSHIPPEQLVKWDHAVIDKALQPLTYNLFTPQNVSQASIFSRLFQTSSVEAPAIVLREEGLSVWHRGDPQFGSPKVLYFVRLITPALDVTAEHAALSHIFVSLLKDDFQSLDAYTALQAGVSCSFSLVDGAIDIEVSGYPDQVVPFLKAIARHVSSLTSVNGPAFTTLGDKVRKHWKSYTIDEKLYMQTFRTALVTVKQREYVPSQLVEAVPETYPVASFINHIKELVSFMEIEVFSSGALDKSGAVALARYIRNTIGCSPLNVNLVELGESRIRQLLVNKLPTVIIPAAQHSSICKVFQFGVKTPALNAALQILTPIITAAYYQELRNVQQLGYVIHGRRTEVKTVPLLAFMAQSSMHNAAELAQATDRFLVQFGEGIEKYITDEIVDEQVKGLSSMLQHKFSGLGSESQYYYKEIQSREYNFNRIEEEASAITKVRAKDVVDVFNYYIKSGGGTRRPLLVIADATMDANKMTLLPNQFITDREKFASSLMLYPKLKINIPGTQESEMKL